MEFLRKIMVQIREHLTGLSSSQLVAIAMGATVVVLAMVLLLQWTATPEMVPVVVEDFDAGSLLEAEDILRAKNIPYQIEGNRILVRRIDRQSAIARLGERRVLPSSTSLTIDRMIEEDSPFRSKEESQRIWGYVRDNQLSMLVSQFRGISKAHVVTGKISRRRIGAGVQAPTASVMVTTRPGFDLKPENVEAIAAFVAGSDPELEPSNVSITDARTGRKHQMRTPDSMAAGAAELLEQAMKYEQHYTDKIVAQLSHIPGVVVNVFAELEKASTVVQDETLREEYATEERTQTETMTRARPGREPGVVPNVGDAAVADQGPTEESEKTTSEAKYAPRGRRTETTQTPAGAFRSLMASVAVPRSYLVRVFEGRGAQAGQQPDDQTLVAMGVLDDIRRQIMPLINAADTSQVEVTMFHDAVALAAPEAVPAALDVMGVVTVYGRQLGLGALAVVSLFLMLMMARRPVDAGPARAALAAMGPEAEPGGVIRGDEFPVGDVVPSEGVLEGEEVDESAIRTTQMVEQLEDLVREDPRTLAGVVKRWLEQDAQR